MQGIADLITRPGLINVDFADVRTVMSRDGHGDDGHRARRAARTARAGRGRSGDPDPLLEDVNLSGAHGILVNVTAGTDLTMARVPRGRPHVENFASEDATVVVGTVIDPDMQDEVRVTVVATGLNRAVSRQPVRDRADFGMDGARAQAAGAADPQPGPRDGTTGMLLDEVDAYAPARARASAPACARWRRASRGAGGGRLRQRQQLPGHPGVPAPAGGLSVGSTTFAPARPAPAAAALLGRSAGMADRRLSRPMPGGARPCPRCGQVQPAVLTFATS